MLDGDEGCIVYRVAGRKVSSRRMEGECGGSSDTGAVSRHIDEGGCKRLDGG